MLKKETKRSAKNKHRTSHPQEVTPVRWKALCSFYFWSQYSEYKTLNSANKLTKLRSKINGQAIKEKKCKAFRDVSHRYRGESCR